MRIGIIDYINSFPLFYAMKRGLVPIPDEYQLTCGEPSEINSKLSTGKLDIALISSEEFLRHKDSYSLLSNLGIGCTKSVMSVRLFFSGSHPLTDDHEVYLPRQSATSVRLFKALCKYFWKVSPKWKFYSGDPREVCSEEKFFVCIGDPCLSFLNTTRLSSVDLAEEWYAATSMSCIFALIATRKEVFERDREKVLLAHQAILQSYEWGQANIDLIVDEAASRTGCTTTCIHSYFSTLEHRLAEKHFKGLQYFSSLEL